MDDTVLSIANQFSRFPAGRYRSDGPYSGERFRDDFLLPALQAASKNGTHVVVELDGVLGYSSSFLEEVFGGVVRNWRDDLKSLVSLLKISAEDIAYESARLDAQRYLEDELKRSKARN